MGAWGAFTCRRTRATTAGGNGDGGIVAGGARAPQPAHPRYRGPAEGGRSVRSGGVDGASARYLKTQFARFRDVRLAVAAYNAGADAVNGAVPVNGETKLYVEKVMSEGALSRCSSSRRRSPSTVKPHAPRSRRGAG